MEIVFLLIGLLFIFLGLYLIWDHLQFLATAQTVRGTVKAIEKRTTPAEKSKNQGGPMYYPVIQYFAEGKTRTFTSRYGMSMPQYEIGETLPVSYSRRGNEARIKQKSPYIVGGILGIIGIGMCVLFFNIFSFSFWSMVIATVVSISFLHSGIKKLRQHDISTLDEFREAFRNTDMKTKRGTDPEEAQIIIDKQQLTDHIYKTSKSLRWVGPLFTIIGIATLGLGIHLGKERAAFLEVAQAGQGEVISLNSKSTDDGHVYYPVVRYSPPGSDQAVTFEHNVGSNPPSYTVSDPVTVLYHPDNPAYAIIDTGILNWLGPGIAFLMGIAFTAAGIYSINHWGKLKKSQRYLAEA